MKKLISGILMLLAVNLAFAMQAGDPPLSSELRIAVDSILKKAELIPIMVNGDKNNRINVVIMNRWTSDEIAPYNSEDMREEFISDINESLIAALTPGDERAQTAYANYREFFNVYGLWYPETPEWNKGIDTKIVDALRDSLFLPWENEHTGWVTFLVMPNLDKGGGGAARNLEARVGRALIAGKGIGKMLHEIAHTCMSIGDEYTGGASGTTAVPTYNNAKKYQREELKWKAWIDPDTPLPTPYEAKYLDKVGAFEGTQYHLTDYFRSSAQGCIMGAGVFDNTEEMCAICEQRVVMRVNKLVNPVNSFSPASPTIDINGKTSLHFAIDHIRPIPNTQAVRWVLNGRTIATNVDEIDVQLGALDEYELSCILIDETPFIRPDPPYGQYPKRAVHWKIRNASPTSKAKALAVKPEVAEDDGAYTLQAHISGGKPPYTYAWSTGSTAERLENVAVDIYDLTVTDSEFRSAKAHYALSEKKAGRGQASPPKAIKTGTGSLSLELGVTASEMGQDNGKITVTASGGSAPYRYQWKDFEYAYARDKIYEAEEAAIEIPGHSVQSYFDAGNEAFLQFNDKEGSVTWTVEVARSGYYPVDIIYGGLATKGLPMQLIINGEPAEKPLLFHPTRPLFTGWEKSGGSYYLQAGENRLTLMTQGKSGPNIDYLRVPTTYRSVPITDSERINLKPGSYTVVVTDGDNKAAEQSIVVPEVYPFQVKNLEVESTEAGKVRIVNPLSGYAYHWYAQDVSPFVAEQFERPLHSGTEFTPPAPGNYFIAASNKLTRAESSNRISFAVDAVSNSNDIEPLDPSALRDVNLKLWFDASDLDGDRKKDLVAHPRGVVREWKEKTRRNPGKLFTKYVPNRLNGKGVCTFDNVWVSDLGKKVSGIRTVILLYKESDMTHAGASPFRELNPYLATSSNPRERIFDPETIADQTKNGKVYLNGELVDPFTTPNPMDYCILTIEFDSVIEDAFTRFEGLWEGEIAEMIFLDGVLSDAERKGIEAYLRKKWLAGVSTQF